MGDKFKAIRAEIEQDVMADQERRFAIQMRSDLRTPYAKVVAQLVPKSTAIAAAQMCETYPPPILATYLELGRADAELVGVAIPLSY